VARCGAGPPVQAVGAYCVRVIPGRWSDPDDPAGGDDHPGDTGPVRPVGSRPLAELLTAPLAIGVGVAITCVGLPLLCWLAWVAAVTFLAVPH